MVFSKYVNTRKHRHKQQARRGCLRLGPKGKRSGSGSLTWPDANVAPPVYRVDLTRPVTDLEHGKAVECHPALAVPRQANRKAGQGRRHGEDRRSQGRPVIGRICPRRSGLEWQESLWNRLKREKQMMSDASRSVRPGAVAQRSAA